MTTVSTHLPVVSVPLRRHRKAMPDLRALFEEYIAAAEYVERRRPATIRGYRAVFEAFVKLSPGVSVETLTSQTIVRFFKTLETRTRIVGKGIKKEGVKSSTIATYASKLHSFFDWLVKRGYLASNPLRDVKRERPAYLDVKALRKDQIAKIRAAVEVHSDNLLMQKRDRAIIALLLFCGLRRGELLGLQVMDVSLDKALLTVRGETSKSKQTRVIPINHYALLCIEDYIHELGKRRYTTASLIVSTLRDAGLTENGLKHLVERLKVRSGVKFHLHQCRHTFATNLGAQGTNAVKLQHLLGHTDLRMTQRYTRSLAAEDLREDVDALALDSFI